MTVPEMIWSMRNRIEKSAWDGSHEAADSYGSSYTED